MAARLRTVGAWLGIFMASVLLLALAWGLIIEPRLVDTEEHVAPIPDLPQGWAGHRVAVIADLQIGMVWDNDGTARRIVDRIVEERPGVALIAGDFIYEPYAHDPAEELADLAELLRPLGDAPFPTFAVLGNHDYAQRQAHHPPDVELARRVRRTLEAIGIRVLRNEAVPVPGPDGAPLWIVGIGPEWAGEARPAVALADVPDGAPRLVMMHNPDTFDRLPPGAAPLAVAGHTHGGQIRVPFLPEWTWLGWVWTGDVHADGWIDGYGAPGNRLYVNRGIGFSIVPLRINCTPELTWFTLRPATALEREIGRR